MKMEGHKRIIVLLESTSRRSVGKQRMFRNEAFFLY